MTLGIIGNTTKPALREVMVDLLAFLTAREIGFVLHEDLGAWCLAQEVRPAVDPSLVFPEESFIRKSDAIVALGGDGTMLMAARIAGPSGIPLLGINLGKLGFLAEVSLHEMYHAIEEVREGKYSIEERLALEASTGTDGRTYTALNEIVIDKGAASRVINLETAVGSDYLMTYTADGLIVSTPTGSTAYSLASGGPIVSPESRVLLINPISPHSLTARPLVVPEDVVIHVKVETSAKEVHVTADGQVEGFYPLPVEFTVRKAPYCIKLIKRRKYSYFDLLRAKLFWGRDVRKGK